MVFQSTCSFLTLSLSLSFYFFLYVVLPWSFPTIDFNFINGCVHQSYYDIKPCCSNCCDTSRATQHWTWCYCCSCESELSFSVNNERKSLCCTHNGVRVRLRLRLTENPIASVCVFFSLCLFFHSSIERIHNSCTHSTHNKPYHMHQQCVLLCVFVLYAI